MKLTGHHFSEIEGECGGTIEPEKWIAAQCSCTVQSLVSSGEIEHIRRRRRRVYHRLPVWLIILPSKSRLAACLYTSIGFDDQFQSKQSTIDAKTYYSRENVITPCFVGEIGETVEGDSTYFAANDYSEEEPFYISVSPDTIYAIGGVIDDVSNFKAEYLRPWSIDEIAPWLHPLPVQTILKVATGSTIGTNFALEPRVFPKDISFRRMTWGIDQSETFFRPCFNDAVAACTPYLKQNTIAAYLLRNFLDTGANSIYESLRADALAKAIASREAIEPRVSQFRKAFEDAYGEKS